MARLYRGGPIRLVFLCLCDHSFRRRLRWERNGTQGESADGRYGGLCGDRIGCRRFPRLPNGRADGRRERLAVRCLRVRLVLHVRRYQVLPAMAVVEAVRSETILGTPGSRLGLRFVDVSKAVAFSKAESQVPQEPDVGTGSVELAATSVQAEIQRRPAFRD
jgi:hypothetical protein